MTRTDGQDSSERRKAPDSDLAVVRRAGRMVALQTSAALAAVLILVGLVVAAVYVHSQARQIDDELTTVAISADDVTDPPPGMELAFRNATGAVSTSDGGRVGVPLLSGPTGFTDFHEPHHSYRALVADRPEGRVVALMDLAPYRASRSRLLGALALAELTGIVASIAVVALFTRRSVRPLAQALALQRRFVADASHELRTPLTVLHTRAQLLASRLHAGDLSAATRDADLLVGDTRNLGGIVDDLLASATMTPAHDRGERVDVALLGQSVCASMEAYAQSIGVGLTCTAGSGGGSGALVVTGSEAALRRALTALVDNALGHQNDGGTVHIDIRRDGQQIVVAVIDDGVGIDQATMATLFNRFSRGTAHTNRAGRQSYGIGLSLVREIVSAHGGEVVVSSTPGRGATFTIALPAAA
ncbi:MAG: HAMP domain-containing sensor histidine kinase [Mycobacteriaceae bacterium]